MFSPNRKYKTEQEREREEVRDKKHRRRRRAQMMAVAVAVAASTSIRKTFVLTIVSFTLNGVSESVYLYAANAYYIIWFCRKSKKDLVLREKWAHRKSERAMFVVFLSNAVGNFRCLLLLFFARWFFVHWVFVLLRALLANSWVHAPYERWRLLEHIVPISFSKTHKHTPLLTCSLARTVLRSHTNEK